MRIFKKGTNLKEVLAKPDNRKLVGEAITSFLREGFYDNNGNLIPARKQVFSAETIREMNRENLLKLVAEYIAAGDITTGAAVGIQRKEVFFPEVPADTQWQLIFRQIQSDKAGETYEQASAGIAFTQLKLGEKPKLGTITQVANFVANLKWGATFGMHREWIEDNEIWKIEEVINEAKIAAYDSLATFMYGLIAAAGWTNRNYATSWITTLNGALADLKKKKTLMPNVTPVVLCPVEKLAEIIQAIKDALTPSRGERLVQVPDVIDSTYILHADTKVYVLVPKRRFIYQERESLRTETEKDIMLDAEAYAWYFRGNGVILDTNYGIKITYT